MIGQPSGCRDCARMVFGHSAYRQAAQSVGGHAAVGAVARVAMLVLTGSAEFVANWIVVDKKEAAVVELWIALVLVVVPVLTTLDENQRFGKPWIGSGHIRGGQRGQGECGCGQIRLGQWRNQLAGLRPSRHAVAITPAAIFAVLG